MRRVVVGVSVGLLLLLGCERTGSEEVKPAPRITPGWVFAVGYQEDVGEAKDVYKQAYEQALATINEDTMYDRLSVLEEEIRGNTQE